MLGTSGMVLPWGRPSRRWRSLSTRSTCAPSVARTRWRGRPPASGSATTRTAESRWLEVPTLTPPPPRPPSGRRKKIRKYFSKQQQHSVFPLNVGESNFSCCEIAWSSIHRIYIVCVRIIMDRTMTAGCVPDSLFCTQAISPLLFQVRCEEVEGDEGGLSALSIILVSSPWKLRELFRIVIYIVSGSISLYFERSRCLWHPTCGLFRSSGSALVTHWPVTNSTKIMAAYKVTTD